MAAVFVVDINNHRVVRFWPGDPEGEVVAGGNGQGGRFDQLHCPSGVAVERDGSLLVADMSNNRVVRWRPGAQEGEVMAGGNGRGDRLDQLAAPRSAALAVPLRWDSTSHRLIRLFPSKTRELAISVLLCFRRLELELPPHVLHRILLPLALGAAWFTPHELWEMEDGEVGEENGREEQVINDVAHPGEAAALIDPGLGFTPATHPYNVGSIGARQSERLAVQRNAGAEA